MKAVWLVAAALTFLGIVAGYNTAGPKWADADIPVGYAVDNSIPDSWDTEIIEGDEAWDDASSSFGYRVDADSKNVVFQGSIDGKGGTFATTDRQTFQDDFDGSTIDKIVIKMDSGEDWTTSGENNELDVQSVITHEFGHGLGLDHSTVDYATMEGYYDYGLIWMRTLEQDDKDGLHAIY